MSKTVLMQFWDTHSMNIETDGMKIPDVKCTRFLGVYLDDHLTWDAHVDMIHGN